MSKFFPREISLDFGTERSFFSLEFRKEKIFEKKKDGLGKLKQKTDSLVFGIIKYFFKKQIIDLI